MTDVEKLLKVASEQVGVTEDPIGSKHQKYGEAYGWNGVDWCMQLVWYCFKEAGLSSLFYDGKKTASCTTLMNWARQKGLFVTENYQPGDVFLYQYDSDPSAEHTGIYTGTKDGRGRFLVIEGNYNNRVETVARTDKNLWGAFRPNWAGSATKTAVNTVPVTGKSAAGTAAKPALTENVTLKLATLKSGHTGEQVKAMQILLIGLGYSCGPDGADGDFGSNTMKALKRYQLAKGLMADGICGEKTWIKLLKG
jgi:hypothetical protein